MDDDVSSPEVGNTDRADIPTEAEIMSGIADVRLSPSDHQRIKDLVNGEEMQHIKNYDRRYLIVGAGGKTGAATRRMDVYDLLNDRDGAISTRLEDFGLTPDEIELWIRVFDILCGRATHIVGVFEDFDGGYVWELGLLFAPSYRKKVWVLKQRYPDEQTERDKFDNGMAASHVEVLLTGDRCLEWCDEDELYDAVSQLP
ncbi:hypothetical protein ELS19_17125 [Halogeometricum borinquense]|uniref:Uncharacterized protein n=1 Tax=Halogeometricum borinquense TaxID=60847 RepID=A0A482SXP4_9EURY|nr:hypothetical protein [Halogeometricum borinquense]RYJ08278.1 hypothetical protein ELS19_17125 [Halogeometricum borinquense]